MKEYECIKPFSVPYYDVETDSFDESQFYGVEVGSVWEREDNDLSGSYTGADIHLDGDNGWLEVSEEKLKECFKELAETEDDCMMQAWYEMLDDACKEYRGRCEECPLQCHEEPPELDW